MNTEKINAAVLAMQALSPDEQACVVYTLQREAKRRGRKLGSKSEKDAPKEQADLAYTGL
jgi:hypothetical protein